MFYKVLFLEILACAALVGIRVYSAMPETTLAVGETTVVLVPESDTKVTPALPTQQLKPVTSSVKSELTFPVQNYGPEAIISVFGDKRGKTRLHQGIDIKAPKGTPIIATTNGFIERIKEGGSGGKQIYLRGSKGRLFYYAHLDSWAVEEYEAVEAGDVLGTVGDTGNAKGTTPHLHFEIMLGKEKKAIDPIKFWLNA
ncbi:M23 family metallopeptidase [Neolewinella aurantiaca]|uniref:M23 family metallopeptidase n=1 Tax=Neolewinella aurantiaca TaxID=2602767 RepID=A0A5C7F8J4_9BACT|nr:M23 family metallopeptidase [Neolewinella aurantiaca]TXF85698.1 M23 family metallopeptidase [Neolewinella aurantiaca]